MLSVVIPCFNERGNVARFETELFPALESLGDREIIAVDDGSTDGTRQALEALALRQKLRVVIHAENLGLGAALRSGFSAALGEWIAVLDADLTFDPRQIALLIARQKETGADLAAGSPYLKPEGMAGVPWSRRLPSLMLNAFYRGLFDPRFSSYTPMFRLYRAAALKKIQLTGAGFEINAEIAARFIKAGLKLAETPAVLSTRTVGTSKLNRGRGVVSHARLIARLMRGV